MSIQRRLTVSIILILVLSLTLGGALTYWHVVAKVRTEMEAALTVGAQTADKAIEAAEARSRTSLLPKIVAEFDGDRHVQARLIGPKGEVLAQSILETPDAPAPDWFARLVGDTPTQTTLPLGDQGRFQLETDAHNEIAEAWSDLMLTTGLLALLYGLVCGLAFWTIRHALRPIQDLRSALSRIGAGDYSARMNPNVYRELEPLRSGFDAMAERLAAMRAQNEELHEQILNLQEEERAELARDLHDDVAPFLFAVGADAAMIKQFLSAGAPQEAAPRAQAILDSVRHMQKHVKDVLRRLAPGALIDLGLAGALDNLLEFWRRRRPDLTLTLDITDDPPGPPLDAVIFRTVQESLSNAVRHGNPKSVSINIMNDGDAITIRIEDDGTGLPKGTNAPGFGLAGMRERIATAGGTLSVGNRSSGSGVLVEAHLPLAQDYAAMEPIA